MKAFKYEDVKPENVEEEVKGKVNIRWLITKETGADHFAMRMFEVEPGSQAGPHSHSWEHEVYVLEGKGVFSSGEEHGEVGPGSVVFIPGDEPHQLRNTGDVTMRYICLIPYLET
jgi:quercetin dioxygenase-like cupin family protein